MLNILIISVSVLFLAAGSVFIFKNFSKSKKSGPWINVCFDGLKARESGKR